MASFLLYAILHYTKSSNLYAREFFIVILFAILA